MLLFSNFFSVSLTFFLSTLPTQLVTLSYTYVLEYATHLINMFVSCFIVTWFPHSSKKDLDKNKICHSLSLKRHIKRQKR